MQRRKGPVNASKITYDGIKFASGLERYCYMALKKNKIFEGYENERFQVLEPFEYPNESYEHQGNGKGDFTNRGAKKMLGIKYTPDFCGHDYIIECKGRPNAAFPIRLKLFKTWMTKTGDLRNFYMPKNQKDVDRTVSLILEKRRSNQR